MTTKRQPTAPVEGAFGKQTPKPGEVEGRQEAGTTVASTPAPGASKSGEKDEPAG